MPFLRSTTAPSSDIIHSYSPSAVRRNTRTRRRSHTAFAAVALLACLLMQSCGSTAEFKWTDATVCGDTADVVRTAADDADAPVLCRSSLSAPYVGIVVDCNCKTNNKYASSAFYQTLHGAGSYAWVRPDDDCTVPESAVDYAPTEDSTRRVICRPAGDGSGPIGYVDVVDGTIQDCGCQLPYWGRVERSTDFEILTASVDARPFPYDDVLPINKSDKILVRNGALYGVLSGDLQPILPCEYLIPEIPFDGAVLYREDQQILAAHDGKWGTVDISGSVGLPFEYDYAIKHGDGYYAQRDGSILVLDSNGTVVTTIAYPHLLGQFGDVLFVSSNGRDVELYRTDGKPIDRKKIYRQILYLNGKYGVYDVKSDTWTIPPDYDRIEWKAGFNMVRDGVETRADIER